MISLNKSRILNLIRLNGPLSRTALSEKMEISMAAISKYIFELISEGFILETGTENTSGGRRPILLSVNPAYGCIICIDFGQSFFRIAALSLDNKIHFKHTVPSSNLGLPKTGLTLIKAMIAEIISKIKPTYKILAISIAVSGISIGNDGTHILIANLQGWHDVDIVTPIIKEFGLPVFIDDSARMMALCESVSSMNGRLKNMILVSLGTGIGTGIIIFNKVLRGISGTAGELGHIIVQEGGRICGCGSQGCLEQYASVPSMVSLAKKNITSGARSSILDYAGGNIAHIDSYCLAKAVEANDKLAYNIVMDAAKYLGIGISVMINLFNPEYVVLGGGGMEITSMILDEVKKICHSRSIQEAVRNVKFVKAEKGKDNALIGASISAQNYLFELDKIHEYALL